MQEENEKKIVETLVSIDQTLSRMEENRPRPFNLDVDQLTQLEQYKMDVTRKIISWVSSLVLALMLAGVIDVVRTHYMLPVAEQVK